MSNIIIPIAALVVGAVILLAGKYFSKKEVIPSLYMPLAGGNTMYCPSPVEADRILTSNKVKGALVYLYLYRDRVDRSVIFSSSVARRMGLKAKGREVHVKLDSIFIPVALRSTTQIARQTEQDVRNAIALAVDRKANSVSTVVAAPELIQVVAAETVAPTVVSTESKDSVEMPGKVLSSHTGVLVQHGVDKTGNKPVYFADIRYRDDSIHRIKGWGLKYAIERTHAELNDHINLTQSSREDGKKVWDIMFKTPLAA